MDLVQLVGLNKVVGANDTRVRGIVGSLKLCLTQQSAFYTVWICLIIVGADFHLVERQIALLPSFAPSGYHFAYLACVEFLVVYTVLALVPNEALDAVTFERMNHSVVT